MGRNHWLILALCCFPLAGCNFDVSGVVSESDDDDVHDDDESGSDFEVTTITQPAAGDLLYKIGADNRFAWSSLTEFSDDWGDKTIRVAGPLHGADKDSLVEVLKYFSYQTGATIKYEASQEFERDAKELAGTSDAQNLMMFHNPGLIQKLANENKISPLKDTLGNYIRDYYSAGDSWADLTTFENGEGESNQYGLFYRTELKSIVWYSPATFKKHDLDVPTTQEELLTLTEKIATDTDLAPWVIGLAAGQASGWPATDWVEDYLIRTEPLSLYSDWITNEVKFDDQRIIDAIQLFGDIALNDNYVVGEPTRIDFRDVGDYLFGDNPQAAMTKQASFVTAFFDDDLKPGTDFDFFYFPAFEGTKGSTAPDNPVLGSGLAIALTNNTEPARNLLDFFATPLAHELWMAQGNFLSPNSEVNLELYASDSLKKQGKIMRDADTFVYDGSDLMPGYIGADDFWQGMIDYVRAGGDVTAQSIAQELQQEWDDGP